MDAPPVKTCRSVLFRTAPDRIATHSPRDSCVSSERIGITTNRSNVTETSRNAAKPQRLSYRITEPKVWIRKLGEGLNYPAGILTHTL